MRTPRTLLAAFILLVVAACGAPGRADSGAANTGAQPLTQGAMPMPHAVVFGGQYRFSDGLTILVSSPTSFQPSSSAYPRCARAVAFQISIRNDGHQLYRLSGLSVSAMIGGMVAKQVVDSTQGYTGIDDADKDVAPGHDTQVTLAFAVPDEPAQLRLSVHPTATSPVVAVYSGSA